MTHASSRPPGWPALLLRAMTIWLPIAVATTGSAAIVYGVVQQNLRLSADDPAVALAQRTAERLDSGVPANTAVPSERVELARSFEPFALVFDSTGQLLASSATLHDQVPTYPGGVFDVVRQRGEDRVTWQPEERVRSATVAIPWKGGFVVAGRSLQLTEQHIGQMGLIVAAGWLATLVLVAAASLIAALLTPPTAGLTLSLGPWHIIRVAAPSATAPQSSAAV